MSQIFKKFFTPLPDLARQMSDRKVGGIGRMSAHELPGMGGIKTVQKFHIGAIQEKSEIMQPSSVDRRQTVDFLRQLFGCFHYAIRLMIV